jgi:DNA-binding NarL/FixJ family response regulator
MTTDDTRGATYSAALDLKGESAPGRQASKCVTIVLVEGRPLTRQCLSRWLEDGLPDLRLLSVASSADLLDACRSLSNLQMIIFSIGAASVKDADVLGKMTLVRCHMGRIPLVLLSDRDDIDEVVAAIEQGVRGYIPTNLEPSEAAAAVQCVAAGGTFVPVSALIKVAPDRQNRSKHLTKEGGASLPAPGPTRERGSGTCVRASRTRSSRTNSKSARARSRSSSGGSS